MTRHIKLKHPDIFKDGNPYHKDINDDVDNDPPSDPEPEEEEEDLEEEDDDDTDANEIDESDDSDDEDNPNVWKILKKKAKSSIANARSNSTSLNETNAVLSDNETDGDEEEEDETDEKETIEDNNKAILDLISSYYSTVLTLSDLLTKDSVHKKVMITKRKLITEEEYDNMEAIHAAVKRRRMAIAMASGMDPYTPSNESMDFAD